MQNNSNDNEWKKKRRESRRRKRRKKIKALWVKLQSFPPKLVEFTKEKYIEYKARIRKAARERKARIDRAKRETKEAGGFWAVRLKLIRRLFFRKWRKIKVLFSEDYRHYIGMALLFVSALSTFTLHNLSLKRFGMAFGDFFDAVYFYVVNLKGNIYNGSPRISTLPVVDIQKVCPFSIEDIVRKLDTWGDMVFTQEMFLRYLTATGRACRQIILYIMLLGPVFVCFFFLIRSYIMKHRTDRRETKQLIYWKERIRPKIRFAFSWLSRLIDFLGEKRYTLWLILIWLFNLNLFTIVLEFLAWYFYFITAFSFNNLGINLYRLFIDILIVLWSAPWQFWAVLAWKIFDDVRRSIGYNVLRRHESMNASYFASLPVVSLVVGTMGKGKTTCITDLGLTGQNYFRRKAQELMFDIDMRFPNFPFQRLEDAIDGAHKAGVIFNLASIKPFMMRKKRQYDAHPSAHRLFGYDTDKEKIVFDNDLSVSYLFASLENYAKLYYLYSIESPLISANYSVRSDSVLEDNGNFPIWDDDFFERDVAESEELEQFCHIEDMDTLRMGKLMNPDNPHKGSKEFGIDLLSEMGKERGNAVENKGMKKDAEECNPLNDGFNTRLKMHRHPAVIENFSFAKIIGDEQREESLGADARDLADVVKIKERSDLKIAMPFYALGNLIYSLTYDRFRNFYYELRFERGDSSLFLYAIKNLFCLFYHHHMRIVNRFGYRILVLERQSGTGEGEVELCDYYLANKKIYSKRFKTDCYADLFAKQSAAADCGLEDYPQYRGIQAQTDELHQQNSYFMERSLNQFDVDDPEE